MPTDQSETFPRSARNGAIDDFTDYSVTPETSFRSMEVVIYDPGDGSTPESSTLFSKDGDGFIIGEGSRYKYADGTTEYIIRTETASYMGDYNYFVRYEPSRDGSGKGMLTAFDRSVLGDGIRGRIGESILLPGASQPEAVKNVEFQSKAGEGLEESFPDATIKKTETPFKRAERMFADAEVSLSARVAQALGGKATHS